MRHKIAFIFTFLIVLSPVFSQSKYSKKEVLSDLEYLRKSLDQAHYNLYAYISKETFDQNYDSIRSTITEDSLSLLEITSLFQAVISKVRNGHTEIPFPAAAYAEYAYSGGTVFPLELAFENNKALIRKNWSKNDTLKIGTEVISINHQSIEDILQKIFPLISAERRYFKLAKIELFSFPRLFWQAFGQEESFEIKVNENGKLKTYKLRSIPLIESYEMRRDEIFSHQKSLTFFGESAYLIPANFSGNQEKFKHFIDSSFQLINAKQSPQLIIDLRNNLGGDNSYSDYLVSYIADQSFRWYSEFSLKTSSILKAHVREKYDSSNTYWKSVLEHKDGVIYPYEFEEVKPQSKEKRYTGKVYVLINRQTHSQAAVTAAQIQDYGFAKIVGEETGDYPSLYASQFNFRLPITGIEVKVSKGYIVRVNGSKKEEGVIPDLKIKDHLLDANDEILEGLLEQL